MNNTINKKRAKASLILLCVALAMALLIGIIQLVVLAFDRSLEFIHTGERWSSDGSKYAVITAYFEESEGVTVDQVEHWSRSIDNELITASVTPKEGARNWIYTYAVADSVSFLGPKSAVTAEVLAVGGDFFIFHPMDFTYGSAFLNDNTNPMGIVLDRNLAWRLFGAENIIGMELTVGETAFTVVGVAEPETDKGAYGYTYGEKPRAYMNYAGYSKIGGRGITIFETAIPNYVDDFARSLFDKAVSFGEGSAVVSEASARYSIKNRLGIAKELDHSLISSNSIEYPYWENEAGIYDYYSAVLMIVEIVLAAICLIALLLSIIVFARSGFSIKRTSKKLINKIFRRKK